MNSAFVGYKLKSVVARITTPALDLLCNKFRCCKLWQYVAQSRSDRVLLFATNFQFYHLHHNLLHFTTLVIGQFSCTKNAGKMVSKCALDLGHFRFGQVTWPRLWRLRMLRPKIVNLLVKKCQRPKEKICAKNLKSTHVCRKLVD